MSEQIQIWTDEEKAQLRRIAVDPDSYVLNILKEVAQEAADEALARSYGGFSTPETLKANILANNSALLYFAGRCLLRTLDLGDYHTGFTIPLLFHIHPRKLFDMALTEYRWRQYNDAWGEARGDYQKWLDQFGRGVQCFWDVLRERLDTDAVEIDELVESWRGE